MTFFVCGQKVQVDERLNVGTIGVVIDWMLSCIGQYMILIEFRDSHDLPYNRWVHHSNFNFIYPLTIEGNNDKTIQKVQQEW